MDCFYAAVEMRDNPEYSNIPLAVGGDGPRSVLCTCNYIARKFGVRSAMPASQARKLCPDLLIVNGRMSVYQQVSKQIQSIFKRYTDLVEPLSLDEAFLDVTHCEVNSGSATLIAEQIRQDIFDETGLTASAGVAPNKFIAKIASDENKPNGQCVVSPKKVEQFVQYLPLKKIPGIGPKTAAKLKLFNFETCADVRQSTAGELQRIVGKFAESLYQKSHGIDEREVVVDRQRKSLAIETTLAQDIIQMEDCFEVMVKLRLKLAQRLEKHKERAIVKQGVKIKFSDFTQTTVELKVDHPDDELFESLLKKALARSRGKAIRLIGLTLGFASLNSKTACKQQQLQLPIG